MVNPKNFLAVSCAIGLGVVTGLYTFGPAFEEEAQKKKDLELLKANAAKPIDAETQASIKAAQEASQHAATAAALAAKNAKDSVKAKFAEAKAAEEKMMEKVVEKKD